MQLKTFSNAAANLMSKKNAITSIPMSFLLVGLQALINVKFSCPCIQKWNALISSCVLIVPGLFAFVIMLLLLRPGKYKHSHAKKADSGTSKEKDYSEASQEQGKSGQSQKKWEKKSGKIQSQAQVLLVCLIPPVVWICIFFIDGDYLACMATDWNGRYACDKELHPVCLSWCKPTELNQGEKENKYERTRELIRISKITGYSIAFVYCILAAIFVCLKDWCKCADPESGDGEKKIAVFIKQHSEQSEEYEMDEFKDDE